jgi:addiction module RelE/StbE family toxin
MWRIEEHRRVDKQLDSTSREILRCYEKWQDIATISGPMGLRAIAGFNDEALSGQWSGFRSSRLSPRYRVIYRVVPSDQLFQVESVTPHDYRRG